MRNDIYSVRSVFKASEVYLCSSVLLMQLVKLTNSRVENGSNGQFALRLILPSD